jgi:hypothetical protein
MGKIFTLEEANRSLIYVAPVVKEIQKIWEELVPFKENPSYGSGKNIQEKLHRLKSCSNELVQVGCILKDPVEGMVDFPSFYRNRPIFLCWQVGEEQADFWHFTEEGYDERQNIDEDFLEWNTKVPLYDEVIQ